MTKAAVSKWETGQSYPDITLLPVIASYFNISIDSLIGYQPQMEKDDIKKLYLKLCKEFASKNFDDVIEECRNIEKKYSSCYPLVYKIALLYLNHFMLAGSQEKSMAVLSEAKSLFEKVETESNDSYLSSSAKLSVSYYMMILGDPKSVILSYEDTLFLHTYPESLVASAYIMTGDSKKAHGIIQFGLFQDMCHTIELLTLMFSICETTEKLNRIYNIAQVICGLYSVENFHPSIVITMKISAARAYMTLGDSEKTLKILSEYAELTSSMNIPIIVSHSEFFEHTEEWFEEFGLGSSPPRDEKIIRESILQSVKDDPMYTPLHDNPRYKAIVEQISSAIRNLKGDSK